MNPEVEEKFDLLLDSLKRKNCIIGKLVAVSAEALDSMKKSRFPLIRG